MTLKTLKDIICSECCKPCDKNFCKGMGIEEYHDVDVNELRQEAIKWIKNCCDDFCDDNQLCRSCFKFQEFFNITEEDLK